MKSETRVTQLAAVLVTAALLCTVSAFGQDCPEPVGRWPYGSAFSVAVSGSYAYLGSGTALVIVDISNPAVPQAVGAVVFPGIVRDIAVAEGYAYVAAGETGLRVVNVVTPTAPFEVGFLDTSGHAGGVAISGGYAFVADHWAGLRVIDVSMPSEPFEVGSYDSPDVETAVGVSVDGGFAYVADIDRGLHVIDVSSPSSPVEAGFLDTPLGETRAVAVAGAYAYVAGFYPHDEGWGALRVINVSDPSEPFEVASFGTPRPAWDVAVAGVHAFVASEWTGLRVIDVSTPESLSEVSSFDTPGEAHGVAVSGSYAYVADGGGGLRVINVSTPESLSEVGSFNTPGEAHGVAISGSYAYVADADADLRVIDVSSPNSPAEVGYCDTSGDDPNVWMPDVAVSGLYAYLAAGDGGLRVIDVSLPSSPVEVGSYENPEPIRDVAVDGGYAYLALSSGDLKVVDVSTPSFPAEVGSWAASPGAEAQKIAVSDGYAFITDSGAGLLRVIDVNTPSAPVEVGICDTPVFPMDVAVSGGYAYVTDFSAALLRVIDVSNPSAPFEVGTCDTPGAPLGVAVVDGHAYVAMQWWWWLRVIDVSDPYSPVEVGASATHESASGVAVADGYVYVTVGSAGMEIFGGCGGPRISEEERGALIAFYNSTNGHAWNNRDNWRNMDDSDFNAPGTECTWWGVECDPTGTHVVSLSFDSNNLSGTIPAELANLTYLQELWLSWNMIEGSLPTTIGQLQQLAWLVIAGNQLTGPIPDELGNLGNLDYLDLNWNQLSGPIPASLFSSPALRDLRLISNQLTGMIPSEIGDLDTLEILLISDNQFTGPIPPEISNLLNLEVLWLGENSDLDTGPIPDLSPLVNLRTLELYRTNRTGQVPSWLFDLPNLENLNLYENSLDGAIPPEIGNAVSLRELHLNWNQLSGQIPSALGSLSNLSSLLLSSNRLTGEIPPELSNMENLGDGWGLDLRWNGLYTPDPSLADFLATKQEGGDWESTQTVAPADVAVGSVESDSVEITWTPIAYSVDGGGYRVYSSTAPGGPYTLFGITSDKSADGMVVTELEPGTTFGFVVQTITEPHPDNQNIVESDYSDEVLASTGCSPQLEVSFPPQEDPLSFVSGFYAQIHGAVAPIIGCPEIARVEWDWGDGGISDSGFPASHTYETEGVYNVTATAYDAGGNTSIESAAVTIPFFPVVAASDAFEGDEDVPLAVPAPGVLGNDNNFNGTPLVADHVSGPSHGTLILGVDGSFSYEPHPNFSGTDGFSYTASDGFTSSDPVVVSITVHAVNDSPVANDQDITTDEDTSVSFMLDVVDAPDDEQTITVMSGPAHGTLTYETCSYGGPYLADRHTTLLAHFDGSYDGEQGDTAIASGTSFTTGMFGEGVLVGEHGSAQYEFPSNFYKNMGGAAIYSGAVEFWFKPSWNGNDGVNRVFLRAHQYGDFLRVVKDGLNNFRFIWRYDDSEAHQAYSLGGWIADEWHHVAVTWTIPGEMNTYIDGELVISHSSSSQDLLWLKPGSFTLGSNYGSDALEGVIDEFRISNVARIGNSDICSDRSFTYRPAADFEGIDEFTFTSTDQHGARSNVATVTIMVNPVNDPPVVEAGEDLTANEGEPVRFTGTFNDPDAGDTHTIEWTFGDGSSASGSLDTTHTYSDDGTYIATLKVTDGDGRYDTDQVTVNVTNVAPTAAFQAPTIVDEGEQFSLDPSTSSDPGNDITLYEWDVDGDGVYDISDPTGSVQHLIPITDAPRTITLRVTDENNEWSTATKVVTFRNLPPVANFTMPAQVDEGTVAVFDPSPSNDPGRDPLVYEWDFGGDGVTDVVDETGSAQHWLVGGNEEYVIILRVVDDEDASSTISKTLIVSNLPPLADFIAPTEIDEGTVAIFDPSPSSDPGRDPLVYEWDLDGDGVYELTDDTGSVQSRLYEDDVSAIVRLRVSDGSFQSDAAKGLVVRDVPPVALATVVTAIPYQGVPTVFDGSGSYAGATDVLTYSWDLGDGWTEHGASIQHVFAVPGNRTVILTVADDDGNQDSMALAVQVAEPPEGIIMTVAGNGLTPYNDDGIPATQATLFNPAGIAVDFEGNMFVADSKNHRIRRVDSETGIITTVAGTGVYGYSGDGIPATEAPIIYPHGVAVDGVGNIIITHYQRVSRIDASTGLIWTVADGLNNPSDVAVDGANNLYIAEYSNHRVLRVDGVTGTIATVPFEKLHYPKAVAVDRAGNVYVANSAYHEVLRRDAVTGVVTTVSVGVGYPEALAVDEADNLFIFFTYLDATGGRGQVRRVDAVTGMMTTVAGTGIYGYNGDGIPATAANISRSWGMAIDASGSLYISDFDNHRIRKVRLGPPGPSARLDVYPPIIPFGEGLLLDAAGSTTPIGIIDTYAFDVVDDGRLIHSGPDLRWAVPWSELEPLGLTPGHHVATVQVTNSEGRISGAAVEWTLVDSSSDTPAGSASVTPTDLGTGGTPAVLVFTEVIGGGQTTVETVDVSGSVVELEPGTGFVLGADTYVEVTTTARFNGVVTVCLTYGETVDETGLELAHLVEHGELMADGANCMDPGGCWEVVTAGDYPDIVNNIICGNVASLSPFALVNGIHIETVGEPVVIGTQVSASVAVPPSVTSGDGVWIWGDGAVIEANLDQQQHAFTGEHVYSTTGVFTPRFELMKSLRITGAAEFEYVVVYDPGGGFVTGGGWIDSPEGAFPADPSLTGKANFGFVSKYKKGATTPTGNTQFQFKAADLNFHSTSYQWLVVAGAQAKFKGDGEINGASEYGFMLSAIDGALPGGGGSDKFRIKIWDKATDTIVYDNQIEADDDAPPDTAIGGGSIVIHK